MQFLKTLTTMAALAVPASGIAADLTFSDFGPDRGARAAALEALGEDLGANGVNLTFFWGGSLVGGRGTLEGLANGVADMGSIVGFFTPAQLPLYSIGDLPVDNSDIWVGMRAMHELARTNEALQAEFDAAGVHYVTNYSTTPIQLICREEVASLADLSGLKVRASGPYGDALASLGAEVVRMSQADVYQALDTGALDCNQNYYYSIMSYKQYEVADQLLALDWGQNMSFGVFMGKSAYDALSDADKAAIDAAGDAFITNYAERLTTGYDADRAALEAGVDGNSIAVTALADADADKLRMASSEQIEAWKARMTEAGKDGAALLTAYQGHIDTFMAARDADGYPWAK